MTDEERRMEPPKDFLTPEQIAMIVARYLQEDEAIQRYELEVNRDRSEITLTDPFGSLYKLEVIDCE